MARMFNMAQDWTYDLFVEDAKLYKATPIKGVHPSRNASYRESFMVWFKNAARDFKIKWLEEHEHIYDKRDRYIGDAFEKELPNMCFSDFYKDTYGQRPHLPAWFYIHAIGFPHSEDVTRMFCSSPTEDAIQNAHDSRLILESM